MRTEDLSPRHPPITTELVLELLTLQITREQHGSRWCRERVIGLRRRKLGKAVKEWPPFDADGQIIPYSPMDLARDRARIVLAEMCRTCPHRKCPMKSW